MGQTIASRLTKSRMSTGKTYDDVEIDYQTESTRFSATDRHEIERGIEHLNEHGYAVFTDVLSAAEVERSIDLFWSHIENLKLPQQLRRDDPKTWDDYWPGTSEVGLMNEYGIAHSDFMWSVRGNYNIKKVFSQIWDSNELFVSFDGVGCFRDWHINRFWKTARGWYHCDQNPIGKPNRCSIQGLVSLIDSDETTGGLVVVPYSHNYFQELVPQTNANVPDQDYVRVPATHSLLERLTPRLIKCGAGDLIVWDSRCIHCNTSGIDNPAKVPDTSKTSGLLRLVGYICMSPASMFVPEPNTCETIEDFRRLREMTVRNRIGCTHWPLKLVHVDMDTKESEEALRLNKYQHSLIIGTNVEPADGQEEISL